MDVIDGTGSQILFASDMIWDGVGVLRFILLAIIILGLLAGTTGRRH